VLKLSRLKLSRLNLEIYYERRTNGRISGSDLQEADKKLPVTTSSLAEELKVSPLQLLIC